MIVNYNDNNSYIYYTKPYAYGWIVDHIEGFARYGYVLCSSQGCLLLCCFLNRYVSIISLQMINREFKTIKVRYQLKIDNFSTHTLRKTWARKIYENENAQGRGDMAHLKLLELMNHSAPNITRRYIGLRQQELGEVYDPLQF